LHLAVNAGTRRLRSKYESCKTIIYNAHSNYHIFISTHCCFVMAITQRQRHHHEIVKHLLPLFTREKSQETQQLSHLHKYNCCFVMAITQRQRHHHEIVKHLLLLFTREKSQETQQLSHLHKYNCCFVMAITQRQRHHHGIVKHFLSLLTREISQETKYSPR